MSDTTPAAPAGETLPEMTPSHYVAVEVAAATAKDCGYAPDYDTLTEAADVVRSLSEGRTKLVSVEEIFAVMLALRSRANNADTIGDQNSLENLRDKLSGWLGRDK